MLKGRNAGGWVLALVTLGLFGVLLLRGISKDESTVLEEPVSAGMVMTSNTRATASDFSAAFEAISAQYLPVVVKIHPHAFDAAAAKPRENSLPHAGTEAASFGCGIMVSSDGYILANYHVPASPMIKLAPGDSVNVVLSRGRHFSGLVVGSDPLTDLALIKIPAKGLPYAKFGDSDRLRVGQWVMAIGHSGYSGPSLAAGLVSAKGRAKAPMPQLDDFIQVDAPFSSNPGGNALVNLEGDLIGISTTLFSESGRYVAIPGNLARRLMQSFIKENKITRGSIGAVSQDLNQNLAKALELNSPLGALIVEVAPNSPAERAGLRSGDVVLQFATASIGNAKEFENAVAAQMPGQSVQAVILREGAKITCEIVPEERTVAPAETPAVTAPAKPANKLGIHVQNLSWEMTRRENLHGVLIARLDPGSPAAPVLSSGDVIQEIQRQKINNVRDFRAALQQAQTGDTVLLLVRRGERKFFAGVEMQ